MRDLDAAFRAQQDRARTGPSDARSRRERLRSLGDAVVRRRAAIVEALRTDLGRPPVETELAEVRQVLSEIRVAAKRVARWMRPTRVPSPPLLLGTSGRITYEPKGVVLVMAPWNYPLGLSLNPLIASLAAGNCTMIKPSERAPATAQVVEDLVASTFEPELVKVVQGGPPVATRLLELPFDHFFFTGGAAVARMVMQAAAKHLASVTLELGGKSPAVVDRTAPLATAARRIAWGKCFNAGQTCLAPDYVLVHEEVAGAFVSQLTAALDDLYGPEDGRPRSPDFGRIVDARHFTQLVGLIEDAVAAGAVVEVGGAWDADTRYVAPTVLSGVALDSPLMAQEIFGPVLPILTYRSLPAALDAVAGRGRPLAAYVFARDRAVVRTVADRLPSGALAVNNTLLHYAHPGLPFGGSGSSGTGSYHGWHGFRELSHARAVLTQREPAAIQALFPPYRGRLHRAVMQLVRRLA